MTERNICSKFIKPVHHMEISLRTQQMYQHYIDQDLVQKQKMMTEINHLHNITMYNNQLLREYLRREWKGLRKFNSLGQLQSAVSKTFLRIFKGNGEMMIGLIERIQPYLYCR